jgi:hypothetical protein
MMSDGWGVLLGIFILFVGSYILISVFTYLFLRFALKDKFKFRKLLALSVAALAWVVSTLISFMVASSFGATLFAMVSAVVIFGSLYYVSHRFLSIDGKPKIIYSLSLAIILNPVWLFYFGILS